MSDSESGCSSSYLSTSQEVSINYDNKPMKNRPAPLQMSQGSMSGMGSGMPPTFSKVMATDYGKGMELGPMLNPSSEQTMPGTIDNALTLNNE